MVEAGEWYEQDFGSELDLYHFFFIRCDQFKDWLVNLVGEEDRTAKKREIYDFINKRAELRICRNVCNAHKHFLLKHGQKAEDRSPDIFSLGNTILLIREYNPHITASKRRRSYTIVIDTRARKWKAIELATSCIEQWKQYVERVWHLKLRDFRG